MITHTHSHRYSTQISDDEKITSENLDLEKIYKKNPQIFDEEKIPTESLDLEKNTKKNPVSTSTFTSKKNELVWARIFT